MGFSPDLVLWAFRPVLPPCPGLSGAGPSSCIQVGCVVRPGPRLGPHPGSSGSGAGCNLRRAPVGSGLSVSPVTEGQATAWPAAGTPPDTAPAAICAAPRCVPVGVGGRSHDLHTLGGGPLFGLTSGGLVFGGVWLWGWLGSVGHGSPPMVCTLGHPGSPLPPFRPPRVWPEGC